MARYVVNYWEAYSGRYEVEANSKEEAEKLVREGILNNIFNSPDNCYDSGCKAELMQEDENNSADSGHNTPTVCKKVTISVEALFDRLTEHDAEADYVTTKYGYIEKETDGDREWFDYKNGNGTPCMDGECCEIIEETDQYILLQQIDEQIPFKLSRDEFDIAAVYCN